MFYYVSGTVAEIGPNLAVIDCGGVGYACATTNYTISRLKKGERAKLFTYLHVREEIFELFGFSSPSGCTLSASSSPTDESAWPFWSLPDSPRR